MNKLLLLQNFAATQGDDDIKGMCLMICRLNTFNGQSSVTKSTFI